MRLVGVIDLASAPVLEACLQNEVAQGRRYVQIDLSAVAFLDCAGLNVALAAHHDLLSKRGTVILTGAGRQVRRLIRLAHLGGVLFIAADYPAPVTVAGLSMDLAGPKDLRVWSTSMTTCL